MQVNKKKIEIINKYIVIFIVKFFLKIKIFIFQNYEKNLI